MPIIQDIDRLKFERELWKRGFNNIVGVDEVGRGCIAGPVVTAAVVLNSAHIDNVYKNETDKEILKLYNSIKDSKLLTEKKRHLLNEFIKTHVLAYAIEEIPVEVVDNAGIAQATQIGFFNSLGKLKIKVDYILSDAFAIKGISSKIQHNIKKGDNLSMSIAAASIIAKVYRDGLMAEKHHKTYPVYGFDKHKGYGTKSHLHLVHEHGPCKIHRKSFEPIKSMIS